MDIRVRNPCSFIFSGPTKAGKTHRVFRFLEFAKLIFKKPECAKHVIYFYNVWTDEFEKHKHLVHDWIQESPTLEVIVDKCEPFKDKGGSIVIVDDYGSDIAKELKQVFTVHSHHLNINIFLLVQNLFPNDNFYRELSRNATHTLVFPNNRDKKQLQCFASQVFPGGSSQILDICTQMEEENPYGYIWFDFDQKTVKYLRIKANMLPDEWPARCWVKEKIRNRKQKKPSKRL